VSRKVGIVVGVVAIAVVASVVVAVVALRGSDRSSAQVAATNVDDAAARLKTMLDAQVPKAGSPDHLVEKVRLAGGSSAEGQRAVVEGSSAEVQRAVVEDLAVDVVLRVSRTGASSTLGQPDVPATATACFDFRRAADSWTFSYAEVPCA